MPKSGCECQPQTQPCRSWGRYWNPCSTCCSAYQTTPPPSLSTPLPAPSSGCQLCLHRQRQLTGSSPPPWHCRCPACLCAAWGGWGSQATLQQRCTEQENKSFKQHCKYIKINLRACSGRAKVGFSYAGGDPCFIIDAKPTAAQKEGA